MISKDSLTAEVTRRGGNLYVTVGPASQVIPALARMIGADRVFCEAIAASEKIAEVAVAHYECDDEPGLTEHLRIVPT